MRGAESGDGRSEIGVGRSEMGERTEDGGGAWEGGGEKSSARLWVGFGLARGGGRSRGLGMTTSMRVAVAGLVFAVWGGVAGGAAEKVSAVEMPAATTKRAEWNGYVRLDFTVEGRPALVVVPKEPAPGRPWIWRTEFFGHEPQADLALLERGWHVAYLDVKNMYGAPKAIAFMEAFHAHVRKEFGLAERVVLEGFSRGGLYAFNYAAAHPRQVAALYLDAPVLDNPDVEARHAAIESWQHPDHDTDQWPEDN
eukprot:gene37210-50207_t